MQKDNHDYYSIAELVALKLPGFPASRQGADAYVKRESWPFREAKGLGGPGGVRREYQPPPEIQSLIEATGAGKALAATIRQAEQKQGDAFINVVLLAHLLNAVDSVAARKFDNPLPLTVRLSAAINAYRSIGEYWATDPLDLVACSKLGAAEFDGAASMALSGHQVADDGSSSELLISVLSIGDGRRHEVGK